VLALPGGAPEGVAVDPASGLVAVALRDPGRLALVDPRSGAVRTVPVPGAARHLVIATPGELLVLAEDSGLLLRVRLPEGTVMSSVRVGRQPHDAVQVGDTTFVTNEGGQSVGVVRGDRMVGTLPGPVQPGGIAAAAGRVATADVRGNRLYVWDAATLKPVAQLPAGSGPSHVRPLADGRVAVADTRGNAVLVFDLRGEPRRIGRIKLPGRAYGLATDPARGLVYVTMPNVNQLVSLKVQPDGSLRRIIAVPAVRQPNDVALDPRDATAYVAGTAGSRLQVVSSHDLGVQ
jgi:sugar lactone lactonase YvrE